MQKDAPEHVLPEPTPESAPWWAGLREGRLLIQRCASCGTLRHYPRPMCGHCHAMQWDWVQASGRGRLHSWTVCHHAFHPAFRRDVPYVLAIADLEEGVRLHSRLRGIDPADAHALRIGQPLEVGFEHITPEWVVPVLHLAG